MYKALSKNVIFEEIENPFDVRVTEEGIQLPDGSFTNPDTGEIDIARAVTGAGRVVSAAGDCVEVKNGDIIFYDMRGVRPLPYNGKALWILHENNVLAITA